MLVIRTVLAKILDHVEEANRMNEQRAVNSFNAFDWYSTPHQALFVNLISVDGQRLLWISLQSFKVQAFRIFQHIVDPLLYIPRL